MATNVVVPAPIVPAPVVAAPLTQYIFQLYWYNQTRPNIAANQMQDVPLGGWANWTMTHNVTWMMSKIALGAKFVLLGDINDLRAQGNNAGTGKNQCVIGAEVLILIFAGYAHRAPDPANHADEGGAAVRVFEFQGPSHPDYYALCTYASTQNLRTSHPNGFWSALYKSWYLNALG